MDNNGLGSEDFGKEVTEKHRMLGHETMRKGLHGHGSRGRSALKQEPDGV